MSGPGKFWIAKRMNLKYGNSSVAKLLTINIMNEILAETDYLNTLAYIWGNRETRGEILFGLVNMHLWQCTDFCEFLMS